MSIFPPFLSDHTGHRSCVTRLFCELQEAKWQSVLLADHSRLGQIGMIHENVTHMSGTSVTYVPGLYAHQGAGNFIHGCWCV